MRDKIDNILDNVLGLVLRGIFIIMLLTMAIVSLISPMLLIYLSSSYWYLLLYIIILPMVFVILIEVYLTIKK